MARFYYYDNDTSKGMTDPHDSGVAVSESDLASIGVFYSRIETLEEVDQLAVERQYKNRDNVLLNDATFPGGREALDAKLSIFFEEHLHEDEEIRYITGGTGYFDVRSSNDKWIRCEVEQYDLLILPAGIYHRFTLTNERNVKALRLFKDEPKWIAINRSQCDDINAPLPIRKEYLQSI